MKNSTKYYLMLLSTAVLTHVYSTLTAAAASTVIQSTLVTATPTVLAVQKEEEQKMALDGRVIVIPPKTGANNLYCARIKTEKTLPLAEKREVEATLLSVGYDGLFNKIHALPKRNKHPLHALPMTPVPGSTCLLNPITPYGQSVRKLFELTLVTHMLKQQASHSGDYTCLSFGASSLYQLFVSLDQLAKSGLFVTRVIVIDYEYTPILDQLYKDAGKRHSFISQFLAWFNSYPELNGKFELLLYESIEDYRFDLESNPDLLRCDLVEYIDVHLDPEINEQELDSQLRLSLKPDGRFFKLNPEITELPYIFVLAFDGHLLDRVQVPLPA